MSQYNIFKAIIMSFYSKRLYQDVAVNWGGKAFLYLLLIVALSWAVHTVFYQLALNQAFNLYGGELISQFPTITLKDGKLSTPENHPYLIKNPVTKEDLILIDTTGQTTSLAQTKAAVLVTQTGVISQTKPNEMRTDVFPAHLNAVIVPQKVQDYVAHYLGYAWIFIFIVSVIGAYIFRIMQTLIYGVFGKIFAAIGNTPIRYIQVVQIAMVAITPGIIIRTILDVFGIMLPFENLLFFILAMLYMIYGIAANKSNPPLDRQIP